MTFRVFRGGHLSRKHERQQMRHLVSLLQQEYGNRSEDVRMIIDVRFNPQIDSVVYKDGNFTILELKNIGGNIVADLLPGGSWKLPDEKGEPELENNPLEQVDWHRTELMELVWKSILGKKGSMRSRNRYATSFRRHFSAWVVTNPGSNIKFVGRDLGEVPWFSALPMDIVTKALLDERGEGLLSSEHFMKLVELIGAEERPWNEWMRDEHLTSIDEGILPTRISHIDSLFKNGDPAKIQEALEYVYGQDLRDYIQEVHFASANPNENIRRMALSILLEWDPPGLNLLLKEFLDDESQTLRRDVLELMGKRPCPEAIPELTELLQSRDMNDTVLALRALGVTKHPEACQAVSGYARKQPIDSAITPSVPWNTLVEVLGQLACEESVPWLLELLKYSESLAPIGKDNRIDIIREEVIYSLGEIGDSRALEPLLERVGTYIDEWTIAPIRALGRLGNPEAVDHLLPFLDSDEEWMKEEVVMALCRIGSSEVYEPLARFYFKWLEERGLSGVHHHIEDTLVSIDPVRTERLVLDYIQKRDFSDDEIGWRMMYFLYRVASEACVDTVFPHLKNKTFYLQVAEVLWRVESLESENRMNKLLNSEDPYERAAAVLYKSRKWGKDLLNELKKFEDDPDRVVRRVVADLYNFMHNATGRSSLLRMVDDEDSVVQYTVYTAHIGESIHHLPSSWVCFGDEAHKVRYVLLTERGILAWLDEEEGYPQDEQETQDQPRKLLFIEAKNIERAARVELTEGDSGLCVVAGTDAERWEYLIKPEDPFGIIVPDRELSTFLHELTGVTHRDLGPPNLNTEEMEAMKRLWSLSKTD